MHRREVRAARRDQLMEIQRGIHATKMERLIGRTLPVLVDGPSEEHPLVLEGRYWGQAPEIDGVVYLSFEEGSGLVLPGSMPNVVIREASEYDLLGVVRAD